MMGRSLARQKRSREARELLRRVVEANPHAASDWVALAMAHHDLGGFDERDFCTARAIVISPDIALPPALSPFRARMAPA
jgi:Flp pilus assembly protein TadD